MQQLASGPSQPPTLAIPYGLVSLWDMMNFSLNDFIWTYRLIVQERNAAALRAAAAAQPGMAMSDVDLERLKANVEGIASSLNALFIGEDRLARLLTAIRLGNVAHETVAYELSVLMEAVEDAVKYERFYHYPRDKGLLVLRIPGDWAATLASFPSAREDVEAAVDCYALGHPNASIHHSMMVLERGLPLLARKLRVSVDKNRATWAPIIDNIRDEIDTRRRALGRPPRGTTPPTGAAARAEKKLLEPCQEAAIEFRYFADVWRNHIAHGRADYDDDDAKRVLGHVRTFMEVIATKLKLKEKV